jgi:hypothetical protein
MPDSGYATRVRFALLLIIGAELAHAAEVLTGDIERPIYYLTQVYFPALQQLLGGSTAHAIVVSVAMLVLPLLVSLYLLLGSGRAAALGGVLLGLFLAASELHHGIEAVIDGRFHAGSLSGTLVVAAGLYLVVLSVARARASA